MTNPTDVLQSKKAAAIHYANKGFYVVPMIGKKPAIKFANTPRLTTEQVEAYWQENPNYNIGLRTVEFFAVDVDTKKAHGQDGFKSLDALPMNDTLYQQTASGGLQFLYRQPKERIGQDVGFRPGIDIKGHKNNYVIVAPSTTEKGQYQWLNAPMAFNDADPRLIESIKKDQLNKRHKSLSFTINSLKSRYKTWTGQLLDELVSGIGEGQRNDFLTSVAGKMVSAGADSETIYNLLLFANSNCLPPLPDKEVNTIFKSSLKWR